ncbi:hypothetical protein ABPG72_010863 [Tetrahymena utriculariae]
MTSHAHKYRFMTNYHAQSHNHMAMTALLTRNQILNIPSHGQKPNWICTSQHKVYHRKADLEKQDVEQEIKTLISSIIPIIDSYKFFGVLINNKGSICLQIKAEKLQSKWKEEQIQFKDHFIEERQNCISFSNIQEQCQTDKQVQKNQYQNWYKQNSPQETSTAQNRLPSIKCNRSVEKNDKWSQKNKLEKDQSQYYWKDKINENTQEENNIISQLSDNLKEDLLVQSNRFIFKENMVLRDNFSQEILTKYLPIIQEIRFTQNEIIIDEQNGNSECTIYFVLYGEVEAIHRQNNLCSLTSFPTKQIKQAINKYKQVSILNKGDSFGEKPFFTGQKNSLTFRSKSFSKLLKIKREDFINILLGYQKQYEIFCSMNDRLTFSTNQFCLKQKCQSCKDNTHNMVQCLYLHFAPRKLKLLGYIKRSEPHLNRSVYHNRRIYKQAALENNNLIQQSCAEFFENNQEDIIQYENQYHTFKQFLGSKTLFISNHEISQIPRFIKENSKEKRLTASDFSDSSQISTAKNLISREDQDFNEMAEAETIKLFKREIITLRNNFFKNFGYFYSLFLNPPENFSLMVGVSIINLRAIEEFFFNTANLFQPHLNKLTATKGLDAFAKQSQETDTKQDTESASNSTALIEKQIQQSRQQFLKLQMLKDGQKVQFNDKGAYKTTRTMTYFEFQKMDTFSKYFPKSNFRNMIGSVNKRINKKKTVINRDFNTSRSLSRLKIKVDTPISSENTLIKSYNVQQNGNSINTSKIKLKAIYIHSLSAYSQNESHLDDIVVIKNQQLQDEPHISVRNEYDTSKQEVQSLKHFKTQQYFNIDDAQLISVRKDDIEINTCTNYYPKPEE